MILRRAWKQTHQRRLWHVVPLLMLLALLPSSFYLDHWLERVAQHHPIPTQHEVQHQVSHSVHCHFSPDTCTEQATRPPVQPIGDVVELPAYRWATLVLPDTSPSRPPEFLTSPPSDPPRV